MCMYIYIYIYMLCVYRYIYIYIHMYDYNKIDNLRRGPLASLPGPADPQLRSYYYDYHCY